MKNLFKILVVIIITFNFCVANAGNFYQVSIIKSGQGSGIVKDANLSDYVKASDFSSDAKYNGKKITAFFDKKSSAVPLNEIMGDIVSDSSLNNFDKKTVNKSKWQSIKGVIRKIVSRIYTSLVLDNKEHFMTCDELPSVDKVRQVMNEHQNILQKIEKINPGFIFVTTGDYEGCVDKSDIVIFYPSHQNKLEIEKTINGKTFFDIPYRLQNQ